MNKNLIHRATDYFGIAYQRCSAHFPLYEMILGKKKYPILPALR